MVRALVARQVNCGIVDGDGGGGVGISGGSKGGWGVGGWGRSASRYSRVVMKFVEWPVVLSVPALLEVLYTGLG